MTELACRATLRCSAVMGVGEAAGPALAHLSAAGEVPVAAIVDAWGGLSGALTSQPDGSYLVVADLEDVRASDLLDLWGQLAVETRDVSVGLLYGRGADGLQFAAERLLRLLARPRVDGRIRLFSQRSEGLPVSERVERIQRGAEGEAEAALRAPAELHVWVGHANGLDMNLGAAVVCRRAEMAPAPGRALRAMQCFNHGDCSRWVAGQRARPIGVSSAGARRVICASCWGVVLDRAHYDRTTSIGDGLLLHGGCQALLTTVRVVSLNPDEAGLACRAAAAGVPLGKVANLVNAARVRAGLLPEWVYFGDPGDRLCEVGSPALPSADDGTRVSFTIPAVPSGRLLDTRVATDSRAVRDDAVVVVDNARVVGGAFDSESSLYLTFSAGDAPESATAEFLQVGVLGLYSDTLLRASGDARWLTAYAKGLAQSKAADHALALNQVVSELEALADAWPLRPVAPAAVIARAWLASWTTSFRDAFSRLADRAADLGAFMIDTFGATHTWAWFGSYDRVLHVAETDPCPYCARGVAAEHWAPRRPGKTRRVRFCDVCGLLSDGDPEVACALRIEGAVRVGDQVVVEVAVRNPYDMPMRGIAVLGFDLHEFGTRDCARVEAQLAPRRSTLLMGRIVVPPTLRAGIYYIAGCVVVGATVVWLQRTVEVES